jgi:competence ComEA-like helix-hairpin-helix protein
MSRCLRFLSLLWLGTVVVAPGAAAQGENGTFGIAPSKQQVIGRPPRTLDVLQVTNTQKLSFSVRVFASPIVQLPQGGFTYENTDRGRQIGAELVTLGATRFDMAPNSRHDVSIKWNKVLPHLRLAPVAIVVEATPLEKNKPDLSNIYRLVSLNLLQLPGRGRRDGHFADVRAEQGAPGKGLVFTPVVVNDGNVFDRPRDGRVVIKDSQGKKVARGDFKGDLVLPGARREYPVPIKAGLPAGNYTVTAAMHFGADKRLKLLTKPFRLTGTDQLPTVAVKIGSLKGEGVDGDPVHVSILVKNTGTDVAAPVVLLKLFESRNASHGTKPLATKSIALDVMKPKSDKQVTVDLDTIAKVGTEYTVEANASVKDRSFDDATFTFFGIKEKSFFEKVWDAITNNLLWIGLVGGLLLLALALLRSQRRMKRRLEQAAGTVVETPVASAEAPVAAAAGKRVNINTAGVEELTRLPGIGPKAAERLIEHREEFGDFATVEELQKVTGFGAARVDALRELVDVRDD